MPSIETVVGDLGALRKSFDETMPALNSLLEQQQAEIKRLGKSTTETGTQIREHSDKWDKVAEEAAEMRGELTGRLEDLEKSIARGKFNGGAGGAGARKTLGAHIMGAEDFQTRAKDGDWGRAKLRLEKGNVIIPPVGGAPNMRSDYGDLTSTELGALLQEFRWDQIVQDRLRPVRLVDMIPSVAVGTNAVEYIQESAVHELYGTLSASASSAQADIVLTDTAEGFHAGQTVIIAGGTGAEETKIVDSVAHSTRTVTLTTNLANTHAAGVEVTSNTFVFTPEAKIKPMSRLEYSTETAAIRTLATLMPMSKQMLDDFAGLSNLADTRMRQFLETAKERQILYGVDSDRELSGILSNSDILSYSQSTVPGDTKLDALRRAVTQVLLAYYPADVAVIHPSDLEDIELLRGDDGQYVFSQVQTGAGVTSVWRARLVETPVIDPLTSLVGSFMMGAMIWDRMQVEVSISDQHEDFFARNMLAMRLEERMALTVLRPQSFCDVTFSS